MFCPGCGSELAPGANFCIKCGMPTTPSAMPMPQTQRPKSLGDDAGIRMLIPVGRSLFAIAAGYLGLLSPAALIAAVVPLGPIVMIFLIPAMLAISTGIVAIIRINNASGKHGLGRAYFGIFMGAISLIGALILWLSGLSLG